MSIRAFVQSSIRSFVWCVAPALLLAACSSGGAQSPSAPAPVTGAAPSGDVSLVASPPLRYPASAAAAKPDPRVGLKPGWDDAGEASWNVRLIARLPPSEGFTGNGTTGSDLAFMGKYAIQGTYRGFEIWDVSNPARPTLTSGFICPASQGDPSVYGHLLFVSGENNGSRNDCGTAAVTDTISKDRFRGVRIFDIADPAHPKLITNVQTCRGSHTHTVVTDPRDRDNVYIYVSGYSRIRSAAELAGCMDAPAGDEHSARFRIEVIQVPLAHPEQARVVSSPHLLADLSGRTVHATPPQDVRPPRPGAAPRPAQPAVGESGCHDITAYPAIGLAGGACAGYGLLLDIRDVKNPKRLLSVADSNMSFWHSATFNNDGDKLLFSDEWGGGGQPRCRATDPLVWGGDAIFTVEGGQLRFKSYYKMPAPQADNEICTAHNGSLLPIPGRDVMVQSFYEGGITLFDFTDASHPVEIGFYDLGPTTAGDAGFWSSYWYNGAIYGSNEGRGFFAWELTPSGYLSQNEIDAAKSVRLDQFNSQDQTHIVWPPTFALARAYLDQLERNAGLSGARIAAVRSALVSAESASGSARSGALSTLAKSIDADASSAGDRGRVMRLAKAVRDLSNAR